MRHLSGLSLALVLLGCGSGSGSPANGSSSGGWGEPRSTFTLPKPAPGTGKPALYHPELTKEFTDVDWSTVDRLYIPAGEYRTILLGGLPVRSADPPLVITNLGGQVKVGGAAANYVFVMKGGRNWVLTGRHDPTSRTGDAGYPGHGEGAFAHSQRYGSSSFHNSIVIGAGDLFVEFFPTRVEGDPRGSNGGPPARRSAPRVWR